MFKIIIVEDEFLVRLGIQSTIDWEANGFEIVGTASNGEEGFSLYSQTNPDLVITDLYMPKEDGMTLIKKIRDIDEHVKIIVLTCMTDIELLQQSIRLKVDEYIIKATMTPENLLSVVLRCKGEIQKNHQRQLKSSETIEIVQRKLLSDLLFGKEADQSNEELLASLKKYQVISIDAKNYLILFSLSNQKDQTKDFTLKNLIENSLCSNRTVVILPIGSREVLCLFSEKKDHDHWTYIREIENMSRLIYGISPTVICSDPLFDDLSEYKRALSSCEEKLHLETSKPSFSQLAYLGNNIIIQKVINYLNQNYELQITLNDVADYCNLTPAHLAHVFKKETGNTVMDYLNKMRLEKSKQLLLESDLKVYEIAEKVGILDQNYFSRIFKNLEGVSPLEYRKIAK